MHKSILTGSNVIQTYDEGEKIHLSEHCTFTPAYLGPVSLFISKHKLAVSLNLVPLEQLKLGNDKKRSANPASQA